MIGASASELMARMRLAPLQPAMCCVAPEIPHAMYSSGAILVPVWPTWSEWGRQPALVTTREQPTAPPSRPASSSMMANPSFEPTPRPPLTTTFASARETPPPFVLTRSATHDELLVLQLGCEFLHLRLGRCGLDDHGMRRHGDQRTRAMHACLFEQAAAPPLAGQRHRIPRCHRNAVGRQRESHARGNACHHVVATVGTRCEDRDCAQAIRELSEDRSPCVGCKRIELVVHGDMRYGNSVVTQVDRFADRQRMDRPTEGSGKGQGLKRRIRRLAAGLLD